MTGDRQNVLPTDSALNGGKYVIKSTLGAGGFGITYRATDETLGRTVAIKELYPQGCAREGSIITLGANYTPERWDKAVAAFLREARLLGAIDHPGIVPVYDYFRENNTAYMVMKYINGITLADRVAKEGVLPIEDTKRYAVEIGGALSILHAQGVLHRDIKPTNIMLTPQGRAVLVDFGAAREFVTDKTTTYTSMGTLGFAAPEQFYTKLPQGPYTDIYGLAATCYYLLTGHAPNLADTEESSHLDPQIRAVLEHGLAVSTSERPQDVVAFIAELEGKKEPPTQSSSSSSFITSHHVTDGMAMEGEGEDYDDTLLLKPNATPPKGGVLLSEPQSSNLAPGNRGVGQTFIDETMNLTPYQARGALRTGSNAPASNAQVDNLYDNGKARKHNWAWLVVPIMLAVAIGFGGFTFYQAQESATTQATATAQTLAAHSTSTREAHVSATIGSQTIDTAVAQETATAEALRNLRATETAQILVITRVTNTALAYADETATTVAALREIAYVKAMDIYVINVATHKERRLTFDKDVSAVTWAPGKQWIAFARPTGLFIMRPDGSELEEIRDSSDDDYPTYSPDGSLYFIRAGPPEEDYLYQVIRWSRDPRSDTLLYTGPSWGGTGACFMDSVSVRSESEFAYSSGCMMHSSGVTAVQLVLSSGEKPLSDYPGFGPCHAVPKWAHRSHSLAVINYDSCDPYGAPSSIRILNLGGTTPTSWVVRESESFLSLDWSSDDKQIAYATDAGLFTVDVQGSSARLLLGTETGTPITSIAWRP